MSVVAIDAARALRAISQEVCDDVFRPPPEMTVSEWADENRILPPTSAEPGRWRTDRVPYLRKIMDTLGDETVREVVFVKSAQVGGTSCGENFLGYLIDQDPCGILMLWPTEKKLKSWSRKQLDPLLRDSDCLAVKFPRSGRRDASNTMAWLRAAEKNEQRQRDYTAAIDVTLNDSQRLRFTQALRITDSAR